MRALAHHKYGLSLMEVHLPSQTLEQVGNVTNVSPLFENNHLFL